MTVVAIHLGEIEGGPLQSVASAQALAGKGLIGDRHFDANGADSGAHSHSSRRRSSAMRDFPRVRPADS